MSNQFLARIGMEKQEEIPKEHDDKYVDILDVIIRNATRPRQGSRYCRISWRQDVQ